MKTNQTKELSPEQRLAQEADRALWLEVFRLLDCARNEPDDQLLEAILDGREANSDNVKALAKMAMNYFELGCKDRILAVCARFLSQDEFVKLMAKMTSRRGILDELADDNIRITGQKDEFLEGLRHAG